MSDKNREREKKKTGAGRQWKVGISEIGFKLLNEYLAKINESSKRKIRSQEVLEFAVERLSERDMPKICERAYTGTEKLEVLLDRVNLLSPDKQVSKEDLLSLMVESFEASTKLRAGKSQKDLFSEKEKTNE